MVNRLLKPFTPNRKPNKMEGQPPTYTNQNQQEYNYMNQHQSNNCNLQNIPQTLQLQPNHAYQPQIYPQQNAQHQHQHQPMHVMPMSPCSCHSSAVSQVPQLHPMIQNYQMINNHNQMRNDILDTSAARLVEPQVATVAPQLGPIQQGQHSFASAPSYQVTNDQMAASITAQQQQQQPHLQQSSRHCDNNSYYSNHPAYAMTSPQQQQQQQLPIQSTALQPQQQKNGHNINGYQNDDQRYRLQQQQQMQQDHIRQQQQLQQQQQQVPGTEKRQKQIVQQQQQYQNHDELTNGNSDDLPLEASCLMHERDHEELLKMASALRSDIRKLAEELNVIREETPAYRVDEVKI